MSPHQDSPCYKGYEFDGLHRRGYNQQLVLHYWTVPHIYAGNLIKPS